MSNRVGEAGEGFSCHSIHGPIVHGYGAEVLVELNRRLIPVQDRPFEAAATAFTRKAGEVDEKGFAETAATHFRDYKEILQIQSGFAEEGRKIVEEKSEAHRPVLKIPDDRFGDPAVAEQRFAQNIVGDDALVR